LYTFISVCNNLEQADFGRVAVKQGCQIVLGTAYLNGGKNIPNYHKIYQGPPK
jgi:hypothetical protein